MTFDPDWPHGHGRKARIICRDRKQAGFPYVACAGEWEDQLYAVSPSGSSSKDPDLDLINAPAPKRKLEAWVNFYQHQDGSIFAGSADLKEEADARAASSLTKRIACIHLTGEEGDGL